MPRWATAATDLTVFRQSGSQLTTKCTITLFADGLVTSGGALHADQNPEAVLNPRTHQWSVQLRCGTFLSPTTPPVPHEWIVSVYFQTCVHISLFSTCILPYQTAGQSFYYYPCKTSIPIHTIQLQQMTAIGTVSCTHCSFRVSDAVRQRGSQHRLRQWQLQPAPP
jgi:hypothetical protein